MIGRPGQNVADDWREYRFKEINLLTHHLGSCSLGGSVGDCGSRIELVPCGRSHRQNPGQASCCASFVVE